MGEEKLNTDACGKMGWHLIPLKNYKKDHCSLTLQNETKQNKQT